MVGITGGSLDLENICELLFYILEDIRKNEGKKRCELLKVVLEWCASK